jgi:lysophospholipase L1-like esterase
MLGATGTGESLWPVLGKALVDNRIAKNVLISVVAVDGASIRRFVSSDDLLPYWTHTLQVLLSRYTLNYVLWLQGEADYARNTSQIEYQNMFGTLEQELRRLKTDARIVVSRQTYCADVDHWKSDNPIAKAQTALGTSSKQITLGPDADQLLGTTGSLRWDGCHPSSLGFNKWALALAAHINKLQNTPQ